MLYATLTAAISTFGNRASQVSQRTRARRIRLRRGSNRAAADVAARLRIVSCTMAARHVLHVCVPFFPDGRLEIKLENCWCGFRWRQVAHFHEPRVLVWQHRHNLRSGFLVCHAAVQKNSFVWFLLQTKHFFWCHMKGRRDTCSTAGCDALTESVLRRATGRTVCIDRACRLRASALCILCTRDTFPVSIVLW